MTYDKFMATLPDTYTPAEQATAWYYYCKGSAMGYADGVRAAANTRGGLAAWVATADPRKQLLQQELSAHSSLLDTYAERRLITDRTA